MKKFLFSLFLIFSLFSCSQVDELYNRKVCSYQYVVFYSATVSDTILFSCKEYKLFVSNQSGGNVLSADGVELIHTTAPIKVLHNVKFDITE